MMKTKIVFVLTSKETDIYLEQLWVSLYSLRKLMPKGDAHVVLLTDKITKSTFTGNRSKFLDLVDEKIVVDLDASMSGLQRSRWLKTKSRELVKGDMLYIDSDTVFVSRLDELDDLDCELGAVKDCHVSRIGTFHAWDKPRAKDFINKCKALGYDVTQESVTYNGGMVYAKDTPNNHAFFELWHNEWLKGVQKGINTDQPSFTMTNMVLGHPIHEISGIWNCQVSYGINYLFKAKILHYYATSVSSKTRPYWFMNNSVYEDVKSNGEITNEIIKSLEIPFELFASETKILAGTCVYPASSRIFAYSYYLYVHHKRVYEAIENFLGLISKMRK